MVVDEAVYDLGGVHRRLFSDHGEPRDRSVGGAAAAEREKSIREPPGAVDELGSDLCAVHLISDDRDAALGLSRRGAGARGSGPAISVVYLGVAADRYCGTGDGRNCGGGNGQSFSGAEFAGVGDGGSFLRAAFKREI